MARPIQMIVSASRAREPDGQGHEPGEAEREAEPEVGQRRRRYAAGPRRRRIDPGGGRGRPWRLSSPLLRAPGRRVSSPGRGQPRCAPPCSRGAPPEALPYNPGHHEKSPCAFAVTGAAGNIGYALLFRIAAGNLLRPRSAGRPAPDRDRPRLLPALSGTVMELRDCAFPTLDGIVATADIEEGFAGVDYAFLVGANRAARGWSARTCSPRTARSSAAGPGDLGARRADVRVLVVGNPANTNA